MKAIALLNGKIQVIQQEAPVLSADRPNRVLIRVKYSAISPGTEIGLLHNRSTPEGFTLGYSAAGMVIDAGDRINGLKKGDYAACYGGPYVYHGEVLSVPEGLCVKLSDEAMLKPAALIGIGAVAVHSVRRMKLQFGENVWVMGLGLLGQIIAQNCWRANFRVFATDLKEGRCTKAKSFGIPHVYPADSVGLDELMARETNGFGFDAVALCAHSNNPNIVDLAMGKLATGGKMAIVGNVLMNFSRELFFQKEADLVIARAAGPGRYDKQYEDHGVDYPRTYVRWTEGRNMIEFIRQIEDGQLDVASLITHEFHLSEAPLGYDKLERDQSSALGILICYD